VAPTRRLMPFTYPTAHPGAGRGHFVFSTARGGVSATADPDAPSRRYDPQ
jgi:hypothetical protein